MSIDPVTTINGARRREKEEALQQAMGHIVPHELKGMVPAIDAELEELRVGEGRESLTAFIRQAEEALDRIEKALNDSFRDTASRGFEETISYARTTVSPHFTFLERLSQRQREAFPQNSAQYRHIDAVRYHSNRGVFYVDGITRLIATLSSHFGEEPAFPEARLPRDPVNLRELALRIQRRLKRAERGEDDFEVIASAQLPTIKGDGALLFMVMRNLISNAIKYAYPGRKPVVIIRPYEQGWDDLDDSVRQVMEAHEAYLADQLDGRTPQEVRDILALRQSAIRVAVIDNGKGIPKRVRGKIFRPFNRGVLDRVTERTDHASVLDRGLGVGLTAVEWAMRMHGGFVSVGSVPDVGSVFVIAFPKKSVYFDRS